MPTHASVQQDVLVTPLWPCNYFPFWSCWPCRLCIGALQLPKQLLRKQVLKARLADTLFVVTRRVSLAAGFGTLPGLHPHHYTHCPRNCLHSLGPEAGFKDLLLLTPCIPWQEMNSDTQELHHPGQPQSSTDYTVFLTSNNTSNRALATCLGLCQCWSLAPQTSST